MIQAKLALIPGVAGGAEPVRLRAFPTRHIPLCSSPSLPLPTNTMQALRLARPRVALSNAHIARRSIAAAASSSHAAAPSAASPASAIPLSNVEAQWERLSSEEQLAVHQQLEELQKRDWKTLTVDEKKAGTCRPCPPVASASHFR